MEGSRRVWHTWQLPFFGVWTGQQLSLIGSRVAQFALVWWLTDLTGSATVLATASMVALMPALVHVEDHHGGSTRDEPPGAIAPTAPAVVEMGE